MAKEIGINITAKDNASSTIQKVGKSLDKTGESAKSVAEDIADGLGGAADQLSTELGKAKKAADALTKSLGPEMASKVDVHATVVEFNRLGATFEDIEANADKLGASLSKLKSAEIDTVDAGFKSANTTIHQTGNELDRSRGVMANFVGNAAQDLPGISGSFGALNVAVGQFAEYATEGGIAIGGLLKTLAPIAAGTIAISLINKELDENRQRAEWDRKAIEDLSKALYDGADAVTAFTDADREMGKVLTTGLGGKGGKDITHDLAALGLTVERFNEIVATGPDGVQKWIKSQRDAGAQGTQFFNVMVGLIQRADELQKALGGAGDKAVVFGFAEGTAAENVAAFVDMANAGVIATEAVGEAAISTGGAFDSFSVAGGTTAAALGDIADEAARADEKIKALAGTVVGEADAAFALADQRTATAALGAEYAKAQARADKRGASKKDKEDAKKLEEDYAQALLHTADAAADQSYAVKNAKDETSRAAAKNAAMAESLQAQADKLAPGSPLRVYLAQWIAELQGIPSVVSTTIAVAGTGKNIGSLLPGIQMAEGGIVMPRPGGTLATIGEAGKPEAVIPLDRLGNLGGSPITINVTAGMGADGNEIARVVAEAVKRAQRQGLMP